MRYIGSLIWLLAAVLAAGCSDEGGIGGTGTGTQTTDLSGIANKGPFEAGSSVEVQRIGDDGQGTTYRTAGDLGEFTITVEEGVAHQLDVTGPYFSETAGESSDGPMTLSAITEGTSGMLANVNVATHIVHLRVRALLDDGTTAATASDLAESELVEVMSPLLGAPANPIRLSNLLVLNSVQDTDNEEGNGWLLALTAHIERAAIAASEMSGMQVASEIGALCNQLAQDLADDGIIESTTLEPLHAAQGAMDPDEIHRNLLEFDETHRIAAIAAETGTSDTNAGEFRCGAFGSSMICAKGAMRPHGSRHAVMQQLNNMDAAEHVTMPLENVIANMNRFTDSDGDGIVNVDDDDDDNDGVADSDDETPYGM